MGYKVAAASSDGKFINDHFGRSRQFYIFEVDDKDEYHFLELRQNTPACNSGEHGENTMEKSVNLLADCRYVLVSRIGRSAEQLLEAKGVKALTIPDFIEDALPKLIKAETTGK
ncbi:Dinitrogenase iron-molybdenum cofactor biosynthesis protein [Syntrophobotulus glycolicus DSM 8271]|uniref:Dinitrogenase iron-molybdenum cofactor biosynthesis protein n=1 Tax=Syntrophobotulus glycolicus (strain DSM 8271 / FlGlyR) TaxID=645991 RepID=F0SYG1_SYNGF|nr:NifB/NifX family molybdenum-iron cluster-binding protein [Syntrophobotulus glycolicus]ADY57073.1 Dinitrogenase iron-molybdenum cofactor biosynthesis protein [Syntrophobotulus glycolicus DSM 8271]